MKELICGLMLFATAFLFHVAVWRIRKPANTIRALVLLFILVLSAGFGVLIYFARVYPDFLVLPHKFASYIHISLFFLALFICYLLSYPAIEADSPSLVIIRLISQSGKSGLVCERIKELARDDLLVEPRLKDLVDAKLVDLSGSVYKINKRGVLFIKPFIAYRKFLGLGKGG